MPRRRRHRFLRACTPAVTGVVLALSGAAAAGAQASPPAVFNPVVEAQNFSITQQRQAIYDTPQYQAALAADGTASALQALAAQAADPQRFFTDDLCWSLQNGCAGDIRPPPGGPHLERPRWPSDHPPRRLWMRARRLSVTM